MQVADYAELHTHSAFSFLDGASQPEELAAEAGRLGLSAIALTDHDGLYGAVRFANAARAVDVPTVFGAPTGIADARASHVVVLARGASGYARLSRAIALGHLATGEKGKAHYS